MVMGNKKGFKAPPVTGINTNAMNSQQKKKSRGVMKPNSNAETRRQNGSTSTNRAMEMRAVSKNNASSEAGESHMQLNLVNFLLNPNCSATSLECTAAGANSKVSSSD